MQSTLARLITAAMTFRKELLLGAISYLNPLPPDLSQSEKRYLHELRENGFVAIPNFWPATKALFFKKKLEAYLSIDKSKDFKSGAYIRFWDDRKHDQGVRRMYHIDREIPELKDFRYDSLILKVACAYFGYPFYSDVLVFQHNLKTNFETREYHVDDFGPEFKAFLYLQDVTKGNGPFTYIKGTHKLRWLRLKKQLLGNRGRNPTSFYSDDVEPYVNEEVQITGKAGTLILADVRGLHRGSPQRNGSRSVLVSYMYPHLGDVELDK